MTPHFLIFMLKIEKSMRLIAQTQRKEYDPNEKE
jgi:hypothetical protein